MVLATFQGLSVAFSAIVEGFIHYVVCLVLLMFNRIGVNVQWLVIFETGGTQHLWSWFLDYSIGTPVRCWVHLDPSPG